MSEHELSTKIRLYKELQQVIADAEAEAEALKDDIKAYMGETEEIRVSGFHVLWQTVTSSRLDTAALRQAMPEIAERFSAKKTVRRFSII